MPTGLTVRRGEPGFEQALDAAVWQARKPARSPDVIVRVTSAGEVAQIVKDASASRRRVSVRTGGHNFHGVAVRDGGVLIDASGLTELRIDAGAGTAVAGPGVTGGQLAQALDQHGLAFPAPHDLHVPIGGFLLAGGFGLNAGAWGPSCFSVDAIDLVTAAGGVIHATDQRNAGYLWAARGAGAGFPGVVTAFHLRLRPAPRVMREHGYVYPIAELASFAQHLERVQPSSSPSVELISFLGPEAFLVRACVWADDEGAAAQMIAPFEEYPGISAALVHEVEHASTLVEMMELLYPPGRQLLPEHRRSVDAFWTRAPFGEILPHLASELAGAPSPMSRILAVFHHELVTHGRAGAFSMHAPLNVEPAAVWENPADDAANLAWSAGVNATAEAETVGHYIASADLEADPARAARCFEPEQWRQLEAFRRSADPDQVFHPFLGSAQTPSDD